MIEHSVMNEDEKAVYNLDNIFDQPDGELVQQELVTYVMKEGTMYKRVDTRRFMGNDYIDSYSSSPLVVPKIDE